jgi:hypothetical protein
MTQETYHVEREGVDKDEKKKDEEKMKKDEDKKKKSVAFKASSSFKNKGKSKKESSDDKGASDINDEAMALLVRKMGKFMKKKSYGVRKRRDHNKEYVRRCISARARIILWRIVPTLVIMMRMRRGSTRRRRKRRRRR